MLATKKPYSQKYTVPTSVDLFCGAGGLTEGFEQAGYKCLYGIDSNKHAVTTFAENHRDAHADPRPIEEATPPKIRKQLNIKKGDLSVLIGGAPCQGFSINAPDRFLDDPRNKLFKHYMRFLDEFMPKTFLFENVPGLLSLFEGKVFERIMREFEKRGYNASAKILFAAHYGVPQERWRLIIMGSHSKLALEHPYPTHYATGRANFRGGKTMIFKLSPDERTSLKKAVTVQEAIGDLPKLKIAEGSEIIEYDKKAVSEYARMMRNGNRTTFNHVAAKLHPINLERLKYIKPGGSWRDIPIHLLPKGMKRARRSDHTKRYGRLENNGLAATIMTKCDPHWGPVFLPGQDRTLTVREAARIQSFPDTYKFYGPRVAQYEQVGNAVPVLMAKAIAKALLPVILPSFTKKGKK